MKTEEEGLKALDNWLKAKRNLGATTKEFKPKTEKERKGLEAIDKWLEESKPLNQTFKTQKNK